MEHSFPISMGGLSYNWKIYDVGGAVSAFGRRECFSHINHPFFTIINLCIDFFSSFPILLGIYSILFP
jgi:hypothetical protein